MQIRLTLKHLSGSRANREDVLALPAVREIILGRDPECDVRYGEADDLVSRKHLKILATDDHPARFMVIDLGSRNGTFVNRQRVFGAVLLSPGGHVQLGAGGPEFEFGLAPRPLNPPPARPVSRLLTKRLLLKASLAIFFLALCAAGYAGWLRLTPVWQHWRSEQSARENRMKTLKAGVLASVTGIDVQWSVIDRQTGTPLARAYVANEHFSHTALLPLLDGAPAALPAFILGPDRQIETLLVPAVSSHAGRIVGGAWNSSGLIVSANGAALTAVPREHPWNIPWQWEGEGSAGVLLVTESTEVTQMVPLAASQFPRWIPNASGFFAEQLSTEPPAAVHGRRVTSSDLSVDITVAIKRSGRLVKAKLGAESSGAWLVTPVAGTPPVKPIAAALPEHAGAVSTNQPVWVVGSEIEIAKIQHVTSDGLFELSSPVSSEGRVVFDQSGHPLGLCIPGAHSKTGGGFAITIRSELVLSGDAANGYAAQP